MWLIFGNSTRARPVAGGRVVNQRCPDCEQVTKFVECDVSDKVKLFFVPVLKMKNRRMVCSECGEDLPVPEPEARPAPARAEPPPRPRTSPKDLDRMLADLKKKMSAE